MRYNRILHALPLLATAWLMASCTFEQEDYFEESASLRVEHAIDDIQSKLVAGSTEGQNGWLIQYFVSGTEDYDFEGFNLFGKFYDNGKVVLSGNHRYLRNGLANTFTSAESSYQMLKDEGPMIAFNTWNDVLTVFVDPVDPSLAPAEIRADGLGMLGDQNLVVLSYNDTLIETRGERYSSSVRFVKLNCTPQEYIEKTAAKKAEFCGEGYDDYYLINGRDTMYLTGLNKGYFYFVDRLNDPLTIASANCVFTPEGFHMQKMMRVLGDSVQNFRISDDKTCLKAVESDVRLEALWNRNIAASTDIFNLTSLTEQQQLIFDKLADIIQGINPEWTLESIGIGQSTGGEFVNGLICTIKTPATLKKTIGMSLDKKSVSGSKMILTEPDEFEYDINLGIVDDMTSADVKLLLHQFAETLYGTYTITPDNYFMPQAFVLTNDGDGSTLNFSK